MRWIVYLFVVREDVGSKERLKVNRPCIIKATVAKKSISVRRWHHLRLIEMAENYFMQYRTPLGRSTEFGKSYGES